MLASHGMRYWREQLDGDVVGKHGTAKKQSNEGCRMEDFVLVEAREGSFGDPEDEVLRLLERESGRPGGHVWTARFPAGTTMPRHRHTADMAGFVARGRVVVETPEGTVDITTGDYFYCPSFLPHVDRFEEDSDDTVEVVVASHDPHLAPLYLTD